mgnify:CR=1 FL=1
MVEEAFGCIEDTRKNVSGNVPINCDLNKLSESSEDVCCPVYTYNSALNSYVLIPKTSAYYDGLSCLRKVGCESSVMYTQFFFKNNT